MGSFEKGIAQRGGPAARWRRTMVAGPTFSEPREAGEPPAGAGLRARLRENLRLLAFLEQVERELGGTLDLGVLASRTVELSQGATGAENGGLLLLDEQGHVTVVIPTESGRPAGQAAQAVRHVLQGGLAAWVVRQRQGVVVEDTQQDSRWPDLKLSGAAVRSILCVPLLRQDDVRGILTLTHPVPGRFSSTDVEVLTAAAPRVVNALEGALLYRDAVQGRTQLQSILTNLTDALFVLDVQGVITLANPTLERLLNRPARDLVGRRYDQAIPLKFGRRASPIERILHGQYTSFEVDMWLAASDGGEIPVRVGCGSLPGEPGKTGGAVVVLRDIRYLKEIEGMRDDLTNMLVHDLKAPLSSIVSTAAVLQRYPLSQMGQELIQDLLSTVEKSAWRMSRMVEAILDVQRLEAGQFPLTITPLQVAEVVTEVLDEVTPLVAESEIEDDRDVPPDLPFVAADREVLRRILWNLLDNALKYAPRGGFIRLGAKALDLADGVERPQALRDVTAGRWVVLSVSDNGPGIPPDDQERIFAKFAQARGSRARRRGVGLGLAFCRLAVEAHGGRIWVDSRPGSGSTFSFALPAADSPSDVGNAAPGRQTRRATP